MKIIKINNLKQKGSFILELMIGLFMSAIVILGVMFIYTSFEGQKRSTTQLGQTIATAAIALYPVQENIKMAGYGASPIVSATGCTTILAYNSTTTPQNFTISPALHAIDIISGGSNGVSDQIIVSYGVSTATTVTKTPLQLTSSNSGTSADFKVADNSILSVGDVALVYDTAAPGTCEIIQITALNGSGKNIVHNSGQSNLNPAGGLGLSIAANSGYLMSIDMNSISQPITFKVVNNQLVKTDLIYANGATAVIGDNIVLMKAIFGLDKDADGSVETWTNTLVATDYQYIRAVKLAILARSNLKERKDSTTNECVVTTNSSFSWDNGLNSGVMDVSGLPDWKCYRYRMLETTVPIKNLLWPTS